MDWIEIIGIVGTLFILISFIMNDIKKIRIFNIIGSIIWVAYGIVRPSLSTAIMNGIIIIVNVVWLIKGNKSIDDKKS